MLRSQWVEYQILKLALEPSFDGQGRAVSFSNLVGMLAPHAEGSLAPIEVLDALKRLFPKFLSLRKWEHMRMAWRDYQGEKDDSRFFYSGDFRLARTAYTCAYIEELELLSGLQAVSHATYAAAAVLAEGHCKTAADRLRSAIRALARQPQSNTAAAVSEATSALECVLHDITGEALTLGKYLDRHPRLFHPALKKMLDGLYGYASDAGARHGKEGVVPRPAEAEFIVTACAAAAMLLHREDPRSL